MLGSYDEAEDLVQEALLRAWKSGERFAQGSNIRAWLSKVATNACLDFLRAHERTPVPYDRFPGMDHGTGEAPQKVAWLQPAPLPEDWAEAPETIELVGIVGARHASSVTTQAIAAGPRHSLGLCGDGTVVAAGTSPAGECRTEGWRDVIGVAAGNVHTASNTGRSHSVGLRSDGTVVATGWNGDGQCEVSSWRAVIAVAAGWRRTLGLRADGTVSAVGRPGEGACEVDEWREIVALACGDWHSVGLRADGTVIAVGSARWVRGVRCRRRRRVPPHGRAHQGSTRPRGGGPDGRCL